MAFFANRKMVKAKAIDLVVLNYPIYSHSSSTFHRRRIVDFIDLSYGANYLVGLGYLFRYNRISDGLMFLREAYLMNHRDQRPLDEWCEVAYAFVIASIVNNDVDTGITELSLIHAAAAYYPYCLEDIRRETIRRLQTCEMLVLKKLPVIKCPCGVGPCKSIDDKHGCQGIYTSIVEAQKCCLECVATVEYMKFRSELFILHCM